MTSLPRSLVLAALLAGPVCAADPSRGPVSTGRDTGRFLATCEDLGQFCFADACGGNQITAALNCRALCPNSAILSVVPGSCPVLPQDGRVRVRLRARG